MKKFIYTLFVLLFFKIGIPAQEAPEGLFIASKAPDFKAMDQNGKPIRLKDLSKKGKVIIVFYRGEWCPFCNRFLSRLQDSLSFITERGATLLAISPETKENMGKTIEKNKAGFSFIHDADLKIMKAYNVAFEVPENTITRYRNAGIDLEKKNGANSKFLPVPAVYVIDEEQTITYRFFETDYKKRPDVKDILKML
ncbi:MAG: hypothetical protein RL115_2338 [Bacteroidota bacterium]|jgi:peroxiredoxin